MLLHTWYRQGFTRLYHRRDLAQYQSRGMWVAASFGLRDLVMTLKVYHFHHAFFQFLQLAFEGNPTAVLGEDAGVTVTGLSP